jgi:hypothetical protein
MIFAVLLSVFLIGLALYHVNKIFAQNTQEILVRFILLVFTTLVCVWVIDKVIAYKIKLLSDEVNNSLFDLIKTLILMIFSYYFGTKKNQK